MRDRRKKDFLEGEEGSGAQCARDLRIGATGGLLPSKKVSWSVPLCLFLLFLSTGLSAADEFNPVGLWYARLLPTESNPVEFQVRVSKTGKGFAAALINGTASDPFSGVSWDGKTLTLEMAHYDAKIVASPREGGLEGAFVRIVSTGKREIPFAASRAAPVPPPVKKPGVSVAGTWAAEIAGPGGDVEKVVALLSQKGTTVTGTMTSASGDYGLLHGTFDGEQLVLMVFNGVFIYRFTAELLPDGRLAGEFRSGQNPPVDWKASRQAAAEFPVPGTTSLGLR